MDLPLPSPDEIMSLGGFESSEGVQANQSEPASTQMGSQNPSQYAMGPDVFNSFTTSRHQSHVATGADLSGQLPPMDAFTASRHQGYAATGADLSGQFPPMGSAQMNDPFYSSYRPFPSPSASHGDAASNLPFPAHSGRTNHSQPFNPSRPANPPQSAHIRSASNFAGVFLDTTHVLQGPPWMEVPSCDPLLRLKPSNYLGLPSSSRTDPIGSGGDHPQESASHEQLPFADLMEGLHLAEKRTQLGSFDIMTLLPDQILFIFEVIAIMENLDPKFQFKYGPDGRGIGARLTTFGFTVVTPPMFQSSHHCKVVTCREALMKMREYNPHWLAAPLPSDGPSDPDWNWIRLLHKLCVRVGGGMPIYSSSNCGSEWHSELTLNGVLFRSEFPARNLYEAQNTVSHRALFAVLVPDCVSPEIIEPSSEPIIKCEPAENPFGTPRPIPGSAARLAPPIEMTEEAIQEWRRSVQRRHGGGEKRKAANNLAFQPANNTASQPADSPQQPNKKQRVLPPQPCGPQLGAPGPSASQSSSHSRNPSHPGHSRSPSHTQNRGHSRNPSGSRNRGHSRHPSGSWNRGHSRNPSGSQNRGRYQNPSGSQNRGHSQDTSRSQNSGRYQNPSGSQNRGHSRNLSGSQNSGRYQNPSGSQNRGHSQNTSGSQNRHHSRNFSRSQRGHYRNRSIIEPNDMLSSNARLPPIEEGAPE